MDYFNNNNERRNESNFDSESNEGEDFDEIKELRKWIVTCRIPHIHSDKLLKILRHKLTART